MEALKKTIIVALQTCKHQDSLIPLDDFEFDPKKVQIFYDYININIKMEISFIEKMKLRGFQPSSINYVLDPDNPIFCWDIS